MRRIILSLLPKTEIRKQLTNIKNWHFENNTIKKEFNFQTYMDSIAFINQLAGISEKNNHHPDMYVGWCKIKLTFTSHDFGGVTKACITMAKAADEIFLRKNPL